MRPNLSKRFQFRLTMLLAMLFAAGANALANPVIANSSATPATLTPAGGTITVSATVTDAASTINQVYGQILQNGNPYTNLGMSNGGNGNVYTGTYPLPSNATTTAVIWTFRVIAVNSANAMTTGPDLTVTEAGDSGVVITNSTATPTTLTPAGGTVTLSATVTDASTTLQQVYGQILRNGNTYTNLGMSNGGSGSVYTGTYPLPSNAATSSVVWTFRVIGNSVTGSTATGPDLTVTQVGDSGVVITNTAVTPNMLTPAGGTITVSATVTDASTTIQQVYGQILQNGNTYVNFGMSNGGSGSVYAGTFTLPSNATTSAIVWTFHVVGVSATNATATGSNVTVTQAGDSGVVIANSSVNPTTLTAIGGTVTLSATVTDASTTIQQVYGQILQNGNTYVNFGMSNGGSGSVYAGTFTLPNNTGAPITWTFRVVGLSATNASTTGPNLTVTEAGDNGGVITNATVTPVNLPAAGGTITFSANIVDMQVGLSNVYVQLLRNGTHYINAGMSNGGSGAVYTGTYDLPNDNTPTDDVWTIRITAVSNANVTTSVDLTVNERGRPLTTVSGKVTLLDNPNQAQPVTFDFRSTDNGVNSIRTVTPDSMGNFALTDIPAGAYNLAIKGYKWLRVVLPIDTRDGSAATGLTVILANGDANNDNRVDLGDFGVLVNAYLGSVSVPNSGYDVRADFNDDGTVDLADFGILVNNYGSVGDL